VQASNVSTPFLAASVANTGFSVPGLKIIRRGFKAKIGSIFQLFFANY
jgi:hypothetical protein